MRTEPRPEGYWRIVSRQFRKNRVAVAGLIVIILFFAVAAAADFIAGDKPLIMKYRGQLHFPVLKDYAVRMGFSQWRAEFQNIEFTEFAEANFKESDWAIFPPIPYSPNNVDLDTARRPPSRLHLFGTDDIGRDTASRIVHGSRVSLSVGFVAVSIYLAIGLAIGALAGY
jgi:peptide/nickel transport system permease protein